MNTEPLLCTCVPHTYAKATPVCHVHEIEVVDPFCRHHGTTNE